MSTLTHPLPTAILGRTGLPVARLGYGAGHRKPMDDEQRKAILTAVLDSGVNLIDTANCYGNSEELIGRFISHCRSEFYVSTKACGSDNRHRWTRDSLFDGLDASLKRLRSDYVDVMQLHIPPRHNASRGVWWMRCRTCGTRAR